MRVYLVGGAVRDRLLGLEVIERDWVVVDGSAGELEALGYRQVGRDFPVFLHPETHEEYALARTERKTGGGHRGFVTDTDSVTLEDDLARRDLTINAIAEDKNGQLIDPYGGLEDLNNRCLRHVSAAFSEDPLRILRVARFAARFPDFRIHASTRDLMGEMVDAGTLQELPAERITNETIKALTTRAPHLYFECLQEVGADQVIWPEISPEQVQHLRHWETNGDPVTTFCVLLAAVADKQVLALAQRLRVATRYREMALLTSRFYPRWLKGRTLSGEERLQLLEQMDAFRRRERFDQACAINSHVARSRQETSTVDTLWQRLADAAEPLPVSMFPEHLKGPDLGRAIRAKQLETLEAFRD